MEICLAKGIERNYTAAQTLDISDPGEIMKKFNSTVTIIATAIVGVIIIAGLGWLYWGNYLERETPSIKSSQDISMIGKQKKLEITFADKKSGLSQLYAEIIQDNKGQILAAENIASRGNKQKTISLTIDTVALKLHDGSALVKFTATDHSLFKNHTILSQPVKIDTVPPQIYLLNPVNNANQGGTCFIAYRISKPAALTGIYVNDYFTSGYTIMVENKPTSLVYFAIPIDASRTKTTIKVFARDTAGNEANISLPCNIKAKKFRADKVNLGNSFLQQKMPEFQAAIPQLQGKTLLEVFGYINIQMREENNKTILNICGKSGNKQLWNGAFLRMSNAAPTALFGDQRTYLVGGKPFGNAIHLGVDLASTAHAPIEAANDGIIIFAGSLGIYGNAVIIDHGLGLFSLYGHLSSIETTVGKNVKKQEKIGLSGLSGLAGGDHLHFSILVGGQFVNPQEWWDPHWISDNINKKMIF